MLVHGIGMISKHKIVERIMILLLLDENSSCSGMQIKLPPGGTFPSVVRRLAW